MHGKQCRKCRTFWHGCHFAERAHSADIDFAVTGVASKSTFITRVAIDTVQDAAARGAAIGSILPPSCCCLASTTFKSCSPCQSSCQPWR